MLVWCPGTEQESIKIEIHSLSERQHRVDRRVARPDPPANLQRSPQKTKQVVDPDVARSQNEAPLVSHPLGLASAVPEAKQGTSIPISTFH